jgi:Obg family GTPase CgtA
MVQTVELETSGNDENGDVEYVFEMDLKEDDDEADDKENIEENQTGVDYSVEDEWSDDDSGVHDIKSLELPIDDSASVATDDAVADGNVAFDSIDEEREKVVLADLDEPGAYVLVARGGRGGLGNCSYAKKHGPLPDPALLMKRARPQEGEESFLELELKLIADLGLVGFPNAGKSSLLAAMSRAMPEIAPYPFTTLNPLVGCIEYRDGFRVMAADVPGLVRGASEGRGRGHDFLRHLERTKALLYVVDAAGVDGRGPVDDLLTLVDELSTYGDGDMLTRPSLVVANKVDLLDAKESEAILFEIESAARDAGIQFSGDVLGISAGVTGVGLEPLSKAIRSVVENESHIENRLVESY